MANLIQIKRSGTTATPADNTLRYGEMGYSYEGTSNSLFIGNAAQTAIRIAGGKYPWLHNANVSTPGTLTGNAVVITDANGWVDKLKTTELHIDTSGNNTNYIASYSITANSTQLGNSAGGSNTEIVSSYAIKTYVDGKTASLGGSITNTYIVFSDGGTLSGLSGFTYNKTTNNVTIGAGITLGGNGDITTNGYFSTTKAVEITPGGSHLNLTNYALIAVTNVNNYAQISLQNKGDGDNANTSADIVAYPPGPQANDATGFIDMGITANAYTQAAYSVTKGMEGYIFASALSGSLGSGSLVLATDSTGTKNEIRMYTNGFSQNVNSAVFFAGGNGNIGFSNVSPTHKVSVQGTFRTSGAANLESTLAVTGAATLSNTIGVTGAATFSNTMAVTGAATFSGAANVQGTFTTQGNAVIGDAATDTLTVTAKVSSNFIPNVDNTYSLGNSSFKWSDVRATTGNFTDVSVSGNLTVSGTLTTISTTNLTVSDPLVKVANGNATTDVIDVGLYGSFGNSTVTQYTGLFRDASDGVYKLFKGAIPEPTTTVDTANVNYGYAALRVGDFVANAVTSANVVITGGSITGITDLTVADGGTGVSTFTQNGVLYGNGNNPLQVTAAGANGDILQVVNNVPAFGTLDGGTF